MSAAQIAKIANDLAYEMDQYAEQHGLAEMDEVYKSMDIKFSMLTQALEDKGWGLDKISNAIHCPVW